MYLTKPKKFEDAEKWIVYIVGDNNLLTGEAGMGSTSKEATKDAKKKMQNMIKGK